MIRNPNPPPGGPKPVPNNDPLPQLNPEIAAWYQDRERRLKVVHTTTTPSGQTLDWIPIESQVPDGKIATPPPAPDATPLDDRTKPVEFELENPNAERGPAGTVPVVRVNLAALHETTSLKKYLSNLSKYGGLKVNPHRKKGPVDPNPKGYFHATSGQYAKVTGCSSWLNVWDPYVENSTDHSLMQCGLQNYDNPQLQSLEGGWTVDQGLNGDYKPRLFIYYTTNGYTKDADNLGGYDQLFKGWVQKSSVVYPKTGWSPISSQGGAQYGFEFQYKLHNNNWWVWVKGAAGYWMGYYPDSLFFGGSGGKALGAGAEWVAFWGEVYSDLSDPNLTTDQMGSGRKAEAGSQHACFQKNLTILTSSKWVQHNGSASAEDPSKYDIQLHMKSGTSWGSYFYAGGSKK
jgi:Neprosin